MPGVEGLYYSSSQSTYHQVAQDIYTHFPRTGLYMRRGITILDPVSEPENQSKAMEAALKVDTTGLALGFHVGVTCHHAYGNLEDVRLIDRRYNQWDSDGTADFGSGQSDLSAVTQSRYALPVVAVRRTRAEAHAAAFATALNEFPNTVVCLNGPIEVELRRAVIGDQHYADYSPYAVKEFRDWLLHKGIYGDTGEFSDQGVPLELIGNNNFSMDPSPDQSYSGGISFNDLFGTAFTTWDLMYWDPDIFTAALPQDADPMPQAGESGHITGGFDPPRDDEGSLVGGNETFQNIWDGWRTNQNVDYKTGFGFRQSLVQHYVEDNSRWLLNGGVPLERSFTHQIPVDFIGNWIRERSSASPFWTAINPFSNVGYTAYFETSLQEDLFHVTQIMSPRWGLFEYHPDPFMTQPASYFFDALEKLYKYRCQVLVPLTLYSDPEGNYKLIDSQFETAMNQFFSEKWSGTTHSRFDQPYFNSEWVDYLSPEVTGINKVGNKVSWNSFIWSDYPGINWTDWGEFDHFEIHRGDGPDFIPNSSNYIGSTTNTWFDDSGTYYKVLAVSKVGL